MIDKRINLKIWPDTLPKLRLLYALTGESMVSIIDRLVTQELKQIQHENRQDLQIQALPSEKE
jgi:hypothetical protein